MRRRPDRVRRVGGPHGVRARHQPECGRARAVGAAVDAAPIPNTQALGIALYTEFLYPLELAAVILLVAIIAAIAKGDIPNVHITY